MNIMISINRAYKGYACIMLMSLAAHHKGIPLCVYILNKDLNDEDYEEMDRLIGSDDIMLIPVHIPEGSVEAFRVGNWDETTNYRLLAIDLFGGVLDRILHLDADILITGDITGLYEMDFEDNYLVACEDFLTQDIIEKKNIANGRNKDDKFFNAGVCLFNLDKLKNDGISYSFFEQVKTGYPNLKIEFPDQDILNLTLGHKVKYVDRIRYNYMPIFYKNNDKGHFYNTEDDIYRNCSVIHMATGNTPWKGIYDIKINDMWWEYAKRTPYYYGMKVNHIKTMLDVEKRIHELAVNKSVSAVNMLDACEDADTAEKIEKMLYQLIDRELMLANMVERVL